MDLGLSATWYDLHPPAAAAFLDWTHRTYIPRLKQLTGIAWVAHYSNQGGGAAMTELHQVASRPDEEVPAGCQYVLLVGALSPQTFFDPALSELEVSEECAQQLAMRQRARTEIYVEQARVEGAARHSGAAPAPGIQFGCYRMKSVQAELELGRWYARERFPLMSRMQGCVRTRKLVSVVGWAKHGVLYEFESLGARLKNHEEPHESQTLNPQAATGKMASNAIYPPGSPFIGERIWPPTR